MEVYILDSNYEKLGYIDHAESVLWIKRLNDVGECELYLPADYEYISMIISGKYVYREDDDMLCEIKAVEIETDVENGDYIIVTGYDVKNKLAGRVVASEITYSGTVADFIKKLITDNVINPTQTNRKITNFTFDNSNIGSFKETINVTAFTEDLLELIKTTCKTFNYGFRVKYINDTKTLQFGLFKGLNKANITSETYVEFSPEYSNIISSNYKEDNTNYKNVCYVLYKNIDESQGLLSVYVGDKEPTGEDRKEIYVDGSNTNRNITEEELKTLFPDCVKGTSNYSITLNGQQIVVANYVVDGDELKITITNYTYFILIRNIGYNTLSQYVKTKTFTGEVDSINNYEYKKDYDLGDVVKVVNEYGIEAEAIITEVMESDDNEDGYVVEPKFEYID